MPLKDTPDSPDTQPEETVRTMVFNYFQDLGFTSNEIRFEDQFKVKLGTYDVLVEGRIRENPLRARSDILVTRNGRNLAVIETKNPDHKLKEKDAEQALSYARLLRQMAPFAIVTNGSDTKVYDVFSEELKELETALDSTWENNERQPPPIGEHLHFEAARKLFRFNPEAILAFCKSQMERGLSHVTGSIAQGRSYVPELFVQRAGVDAAFYKWLDSDLPVFAITGDSGSGKTNAMCHLAERASSEHLVLFYQAADLPKDLRSAIETDLVWEFEAEKGIVFFINRLSEFASKRNCNVIIVVDGLDEFVKNQRSFKNELSDLAQRLRGSPVKLCLSCKSFDWKQYVIDNGRTYNEFAKNIFPAREIVHQPSVYSEPNPREIGVWLTNFSDDEKKAAFDKYKIAYDLTGELKGTLAYECAMPFMMQVIAEAYTGSPLPLSGSLSNVEIFRSYWRRRIKRLRAELQDTAEIMLLQVAAVSVATGKRVIELSDLRVAMNRQSCSWNDHTNKTFRELIRHNLLTKAAHDSRVVLRFSFEWIRAYAYTIIANRWHESDSDSTLEGIQAVSDNHIGLETIEFYFTHIDRGQTALLTDIAVQNFDLFSCLASNLKFQSSLHDLLPEQQWPVYLQRLEQFADAHTKFKRTYFPNLTTRICPYSANPTGVVISDNGTFFQLRECTDQVPKRIVRLDEHDAASRYLGGKRLPQEIGAAGVVHLGTNELVQALPQKVAWDMILEDVSKALKASNLNESDSPLILQERI